MLAGLRARCEVLQEEPFMVVDVSHNASGIQAALRFMDDAGDRSSPLQVMIGLAAEKEIDPILDALVEANATVAPVLVEAKRMLPADELAVRARQKGLRILEIASPEAAFSRFLEHATPKSRLLATGSHFVIGALPKRLFEPMP